MTAPELLADLHRLGVRLEWVDGELLCRAPPGALTAELRTAIDERKAEILSLLEERGELSSVDVDVSSRPQDRGCIHECFREVAGRIPGSIAAVAGDRCLSYGELDRRSNVLARRLIARGVRADAPVAVFMERSLEMLVALLGVLKAGAAYVPLSPDYPESRLRMILDDTSAAVILTTPSLRDAIPDVGPPILCIDRDRASPVAESISPPVSCQPEQLAYIMYTSGSTGRPKGVEVPHRAVLRLVFGLDEVSIAQGDAVLHASSPSFDASTFEIWSALLHGGRSVLLPGRVPGAAEIGRILHEHRVATAWLTASLFNAVIDEAPEALSTLGQLLIGGEALSLPHVRRALGLLSGTTIVNGYGPTENTTFTCCYPVPRNLPATTPSVPIGRPIGGTQVCILDRNMSAVPVRMPGELFAGGDGLARGYLGRPDLTAERFVPNPFSRRRGGRLYRTGDLCRWSEDGEIQFLGRVDRQVKLRGYRIEPGEIEAILRQHSGVRDVALMARDEGPVGPRLVAYVVPELAALGASTAKLESERVLQWRHLYQDTYRSDNPTGDPAFNIVGWNSSYTGRAIPPEQMREWQERTLERIRALGPRRVLEIGCGTGLLLLRLAPECEEYWGTDFSLEVLDQLRAEVAKRELAGVTLLERAADELEGIPVGYFDTVILNSVVQYFPNRDYLLRVLSRVARMLQPGGIIFIGDVRNLRLLEAFHASVQLGQVPASMPRARLWERVRQQSALETELVIDPTLFLTLRRHLPEIRAVGIHLKRGRYRNELTGFRYDLTLGIGEAPLETPAVAWLDWRREGLTVAEIERRLIDDRPFVLGLRNVPNARVATAVDTARLVASVEGPETAGKLRRAIEVSAAEGVDPESFWRLGEELPYRVDVGWSRSPAEGGYDVLLRRRNGEPPSREASLWTELVDEPEPEPSRGYCTHPLRANLVARLIPVLRRYAEERLPDYMVPSAFVALDSFPLTPNGKLDWRALPAPETSRPELAADFVAPRTTIETRLATLWSEVLGIDRIGIYDNFFELGGHSLLATQLVSRVRDTFQLELPLRKFFDAPTVAVLADLIERTSSLPSLPPIERVTRERDLPLSFAQQRLWFLDRLIPGKAVYNLPAAVRLEGDLDLFALRRTFEEIVRRHEVLRTSFQMVDGRPVQVISPSFDLGVPLIDLSSLSAASRRYAIERLTQAEGELPFDLGRGPLLRITLLRLDELAHVVLLTMHHIVSDGWSMGVLIREVSLLYHAFAGGLPSPLSDLGVQYADYACWQRQWLVGEVLQREIDHWKRRLDGMSTLELSADRPRPAVPTFRGRKHNFGFSATLMSRLERLPSRGEHTLFMILLAAFQVLLSRYSGQTDISVGSPIANRTRSETEGLIGFFVNTLVLRNDLSGNVTFRELLERTRSMCLDAYAHQELPFEKLVDALNPDRDMSRHPLIQVMFALQNAPMPAVDLPRGLKLEAVETDSHSAKFDLLVSAWTGDDGLYGFVEYSTDLFDGSTITRMMGHYQTLVSGLASDPEARLGELPLLGEAERHQLLVDWSVTAGTRREGGWIHEEFERRVRRVPDRVAVVYQESHLTYRELNARANQLARHLRDLGVGAESLVGIGLERSLELMVGLLGILKAGAAYLPLDPDYPEQRLCFMLEDAGASALVGARSLDGRLQKTATRRVLLDEDAEAISRKRPENLGHATFAGNLAYVIYTSGSTGRPKGVMNHHHGISNRLQWMQEAYGLEADDRVLQKTPSSFDVSVWEFFWPLMTGACLVMARPGGHRDGGYLVEEIVRERITTVHFVPSMLRVFLEEREASSCESLRRVISSGEALPVDLQERFRRRLRAELHNLYGPTEASVDVSHWHCRPDRPDRAYATVPIGRPIANIRLYVSDRSLEPSPLGVPGELLIGGTGLARGYLHRPSLTAERFIPDPFAEAAGARLYRTGDRARWLTGGELEFQGRLDNQVKLRGFRIELGEIEAILNDHASVREAVVVVRTEESEHQRLTAYVVLESAAVETARATPSLQQFLTARLPHFMVPQEFVFLDALPLTPNGKIDRKALPKPDRVRPGLEESYVPPRTPEEEKLARVWSDVLGIERVGVKDNFFVLGGDSILSIQIVSRAQRENLVFTPQQLFQHQTIAELALVAGMRAPIHADQGEVTGPVPLLPIEHWFFDQDHQEPDYFNQTLFLDLRRSLDPSRLLEAVLALVAHHDALRLRLRREGVQWRQRIAPFVRRHERRSFVSVDLRALAETAARAALEAAAARLQASLDLDVGPILRVAHFRIGDGSERVLIAIHHVAVDGVSWRILLEDLLTAYQQLERGISVALLPKTTSFREWAERLSAYASAEELSAEAPYWRALADAGPAPIPVDFDEGVNDVASQEVVVVTLSMEETRALLQDVPRAYRTQINDALLTAFVTAFSAWTGERSLLLDLEGHGREELFADVDLSRTVGWFTSVFTVRLGLPVGDPGVTLLSVKEQLRAIPHRGVGYGVLRYLRGDRELAEKLASSKPEVSFNYMGQLDNVLPEGVPLRLAPESPGPLSSPRDRRPHRLYVTGGIRSGTLQMIWTFSRNLHRRETVERIAAGFLASLRELITHCQSPGAGGVSPSDFPLVSLDQAAVDRLVTKDDPVEDIYSLSSLQLGLLFHAMYTPGSRLYFQQLVTTFRGDLDVSIFRRVWQRVVDRHAILRTAFAWEGLPEPVQIVHESAQIPWEELDFRHLPEDEKRERIEAFLEEDQRRGLVLTRPPLMRITLIHVESDCWQIVWSFHHLILDGWSLPLLLNEVILLYEGIVRGHEIAMPQPRPFRDYIAWLRRQDLDSAETYWREVLDGLEGPTPLGIDRPGETGWEESDLYGEDYLHLSEEATSTLTQFARAHRLTLNTILQGAWALLLGYYTGRDDVVYGTTVSGRPPLLPGVESMIGLFINMLPVRTRIDAEESLPAWLERLQMAQARMREYEFTPLVQIRRWSDLPSGAPMFESTLNFDNYPVDSSFREQLSLTVENLRHVERTNYPVVMMAACTSHLTVWLRYNRRRIDPAAARRLLEHLEALLLAVGERPDARLVDLQKVVMAMDEKQRIEDREKRVRTSQKKFREIVVRPVKIETGDWIEAEPLRPERPLPLVMRPKIGDLDLVEWAAAHLSLLDAKLSEHGAILFRGFELPAVADFERFASTVCSDQLFEEYGDLPREEVGSRIYGTTVYPADKSILFHNESSHMQRWPLRILFYCKLAARQGGQTPIVDCREVYRRLDPSLRERFRGKGLLYVRNFTDGLDVAWQDFFRTNDEADVERFCRDNEMECEWKPDGSLRVLQRRRAITTHPGTGDPVFFNQVLLHHPSSLDPEVRESLLSIYQQGDLPRNVLYGDGQPIEDEVITGLGQLYRELAVEFPWQAGDVLLVDNMLTAHSRNPFGGPRKILVALGQMTSDTSE